MQQRNSVSGPHFTIDSADDPAEPINNQSLFYTHEQDDDVDLHLPAVDYEEDQAGQSSPFVLPFQNSAALPTVSPMNASGNQGAMGATGPASSSPAPSGKAGGHSFRVFKFLLIGCVVFLTVVGSSLFVFAQSTTAPAPTQRKGVHATATAPAHATPGTATNKHVSPSGSRPTPAPSPNQDPQNQGQGAGTPSSNHVPSAQQLTQLGWVQTGLSVGDAIEAQRTGAAFTDTEMSYDYRDSGTRDNHGGTLTSSTTLLTPGGQVRFAHNDVRAINNVLYDTIQKEKLIQQVVNPQSSLTQFQVIQVQGQSHKYAWVTVSFQLLRSKIDPTSGNRIETLDTDPATGQPRIHSLSVGLLRVYPQNQGPHAPLGGTGWLVNMYALDAATLPGIATNPSL